MAEDLRSLLETVDAAIAAYKQRIRELELTVSNQQRIIEELRNQSGQSQRSDGNGDK
jgi:prefoldin subunit 5